LHTHKTLFFAAVFYGVIFPAFSQHEFKDGFIIKDNQTYVYGHISFTQSPHLNCVFKERMEDAPVTYTTEQIEAYGILNGNHFRKKPITFSGETSTKEIFMEAVADGTVTLYTVFGRMFIERGSSFYELKDEKEKRESYRSIVASLVSGCGSAARKVKTAAIEIHSIKSIVEAYNKCAAGGKATAGKKSRSGKELGLFVGIDRTQFSIAHSTVSSLNKKIFTDRTLMNAGVHFKMKPKWSEHFSVVTGLWFNDQRLYLASEDNSNGTSLAQVFRINYRSLRFPLLLEVGNFVTTKVQPYAKGGLSFPLLLNSEVTFNRENESNNIVYMDRYEASKNFKEPVLLQLLAGASLPLGHKLHAYGEVYYSRGKSKFVLEAPQKGTVTGNFRSTGFNVGLVIRTY
jgi:hypothetical protein